MVTATECEPTLWHGYWRSGPGSLWEKVATAADYAACWRELRVQAGLVVGEKRVLPAGQTPGEG
jgi:hypothetical protein